MHSPWKNPLSWTSSDNRYMNEKDSRWFQSPIVQVLLAIQVFPVEAPAISEESEAIPTVPCLNSCPTESKSIIKW